MNIQHLVFNSRRRGLPEEGMKRRLSEANGGVVDMNCPEVGVGMMTSSTPNILSVFLRRSHLQLQESSHPSTQPLLGMLQVDKYVPRWPKCWKPKDSMTRCRKLAASCKVAEFILRRDWEPLQRSDIGDEICRYRG